MNDEETKEDDMPYGCKKWGPCALDDQHDGSCRDHEDNERRASSLMRERWAK